MTANTMEASHWEARMPLYNREDMELELELIEMASQQLSAKVASGEISGLECLKKQSGLDYMVRQAKGKLLRTQNLVADISAKKRVIQEAANAARNQPTNRFAKGVVRQLEDELGRLLGRAKFNQSPFRVKAPDGEIVSTQEAMEV